MSGELKPCPFCGDVMEDRRGLVMHRHRHDCIIGANAFPIEWADRWNRRSSDLHCRVADCEATGECKARSVGMPDHCQSNPPRI